MVLLLVLLLACMNEWREMIVSLEPLKHVLVVAVGTMAMTVIIMMGEMKI